jgi:hypothetical protein
MTLFLDFRTKDVGGSVIGPYLREGNGANINSLVYLTPEQVSLRLSRKNLLFVAHGFNVSRPYGAFSIGALDDHLALSRPDLLIGVLWPGDFWIPAINYPFEGNVAMSTGKLLADFCNRQCTGTQSLSFASHSLGARVVLEALLHIDKRQVRSVCLTAAAVNQDCFLTEYIAATKISDRIFMLASEEDEVLRLAYAIGDPFADLLHRDHSLFSRALGRDGPPIPAAAPLTAPWQIPKDLDYGHGDYLPKNPPMGDKWIKAADFMKNVFHGRALTWPIG